MTEWISVDSALPELHKRVLICYSNLYHKDYISIDYRSDPKDGNIWACTSKSGVTHWKELPEPPNEEKKKDIQKKRKSEWHNIKEKVPDKPGWYDVITLLKPEHDSEPIKKLERLYYDGTGIGGVIYWREERMEKNMD